MNWALRALGALTAGYGAAVLVAPKVLAGPCELTQPDGSLAAPVAILCRAVGARDLISGAAMAVAPAGSPLRWAAAVRVGCDASDAIGFGLTLPSADARRKAALVAGGWAALCALAASRAD